MPKNIIVHTVSSPDGVGDLVYFLSWYKMFNKHAPQIEDRVLIFIRFKNFATAIFKDLFATDPQHPIFKLIAIKFDSASNSHFLETKDRNRSRIVGLSGLSLFENVEILNIYFKDITAHDNVMVFYLSCSYATIFKDRDLTPVNKSYMILELDAPYKNQALGISKENLGLLFDQDGINGNEEISASLECLSDTNKEIIFDKKSISLTAAQQYLADNLFIFAYFQRFVNTSILHSVLKSPIVQQHIKQNKVPLFFITSSDQNIEIPNEIQAAIKAKKIRLHITPWVDGIQYKALSCIFLNKNTKSIIIPSGDNSLVACIRTGKLPFYAHKYIKDNDEPVDFKCNIFANMASIMQESLKKNQFPEHPGYLTCLKTLQHLSTRYTVNPYSYSVYNLFAGSCFRNKLLQHTCIKGEALDNSALDFFHDHFSPYLLANFDFEKLTMPKILETLANEMPEQQSLKLTFF